MLHLWITLLIVSCNSQGFKGGQKSNAVLKPTPTPQTVDQQRNPIPNPSPPVRNDCPESAGITQVTLLSSQIRNNQPNQFLEYELTLKDCKGDPKPLNGLQILFDIDGSSSSFGNSSFGYEIFPSGSGAGQKYIQGQLKDVLGSDLFGNRDNILTGEKYAHWRTDNVNFDANTVKVILKIDVSSNAFIPRNSPGGVATGSFVIPTHLRFGEAKPVEQPVTFINN